MSHREASSSSVSMPLQEQGPSQSMRTTSNAAHHSRPNRHCFNPQAAPYRPSPQGFQSQPTFHPPSGQLRPSQQHVQHNLNVPSFCHQPFRGFGQFQPNVPSVQFQPSQQSNWRSVNSPSISARAIQQDPPFLSNHTNIAPITTNRPISTPAPYPSNIIYHKSNFRKQSLSPVQPLYRGSPLPQSEVDRVNRSCTQEQVLQEDLRQSQRERQHSENVNLLGFDYGQWSMSENQIEVEQWQYRRKNLGTGPITRQPICIHKRPAQPSTPPPSSPNGVRTNTEGNALAVTFPAELFSSPQSSLQGSQVSSSLTEPSPVSIFHPPKDVMQEIDKPVSEREQYKSPLDQFPESSMAFRQHSHQQQRQGATLSSMRQQPSNQPSSPAYHPHHITPVHRFSTIKNSRSPIPAQFIVPDGANEKSLEQQPLTSAPEPKRLTLDHPSIKALWDDDPLPEPRPKLNEYYSFRRPAQDVDSDVIYDTTPTGRYPVPGARASKPEPGVSRGWAEIPKEWKPSHTLTALSKPAISAPLAPIGAEKKKKKNYQEVWGDTDPAFGPESDNAFLALELPEARRKAFLADSTPLSSTAFGPPKNIEASAWAARVDTACAKQSRFMQLGIVNAELERSRRRAAFDEEMRIKAPKYLLDRKKKLDDLAAQYKIEKQKAAPDMNKVGAIRRDTIKALTMNANASEVSRSEEIVPTMSRGKIMLTWRKPSGRDQTAL